MSTKCGKDGDAVDGSDDSTSSEEDEEHCKKSRVGSTKNIE